MGCQLQPEQLGKLGSRMPSYVRLAEARPDGDRSIILWREVLRIFSVEGDEEPEPTPLKKQRASKFQNVSS